MSGYARTGVGITFAAMSDMSNLKTSSEPRGIRNNNPCNLVHLDRNKWQGLADPPTDGRFCVFVSPIYGLRAAALNLIAYQDRQGLRTIQAIVERWAPPSENDVAAYVASIRAQTGISPDRFIDVHSYNDIRPLLAAMIRHENGLQPYTDAQIDKALTMAGVEPPMQSMRKSRTVKGGQVAGAAGAATTVAGALSEWAPALPAVEFIKNNLGLVLIVAGAAVLAGVGYMIWARFDDRRKGLR
ncbi:MAG: structural protein [Rhodospirillales bacterium]